MGDPCYSVPDERWIEWLEAADYMSEPDILLADIDGKPVLGISTAHGDGQYYDEEGRSYPVDAGLIGLVPVELAEGEPSGAHRVTFTSDILCETYEGKIVLGHITIDTDPDEDDMCYECGYSEWNCHCEEEVDEDDDDDNI